MKLDNLLTELKNLQNSTIGLFKPHQSDVIELVVANENGYLKTLVIGRMGALQTTHTDASNGKLVMFLDGSTLTDMMYNNHTALRIICDSLLNQ